MSIDLVLTKSPMSKIYGGIGVSFKEDAVGGIFPKVSHHKTSPMTWHTQRPGPILCQVYHPLPCGIAKVRRLKDKRVIFSNDFALFCRDTLDGYEASTFEFNAASHSYTFGSRTQKSQHSAVTTLPRRQSRGVPGACEQGVWRRHLTNRSKFPWLKIDAKKSSTFIQYGKVPNYRVVLILSREVFHCFSHPEPWFAEEYLGLNFNMQLPGHGSSDTVTRDLNSISFQDGSFFNKSQRVRSFELCVFTHSFFNMLEQPFVNKICNLQL